MSRKTTPTRDRWWYLTEPLSTVVKTHRALMYTPRTMTADEPMGWIEPREEYWLPVIVNPALSVLERECVFRGLLAAEFGVDTTNWPVPMDLSGKGDR
ncbi:hypothetical protein ABTY96_28545 [Streptomyces sp. NPDC096057]|uniref:hypothetical protein n=1 Tax=Streptomyces sp. NPDC096057 TaxID=3155543 RepID=UPI00331A243A